MMIVIAIGTTFAILVIIGMMQQEEIRLWKRHQERTAEQRRAEVEQKKRAAADRIKTMLRDRRGEIDEATQQMSETDTGEPAGAGASAGGQPDPSRASEAVSVATPN